VLQPLFPAITDTVVAIGGGILLFVVPVDLGNREFLLDWGDATRIPWGVLLLLGAGFSLANGFQASGLDTVIAQGLAGIAGVPLLVLVLIIATVVVFLTEVTSNTATATVFMPIMIGLGATLGVAPLTLMATATLAASFAFMLPVATPPNAVVFGSGYVTIPQMSRAGLWLNLLGIVAIVALTYLWLPIAFSIAG
jgi:sodium-dependent dicarboxylate transporter 2/3/5